MHLVLQWLRDGFGQQNFGWFGPAQGLGHFLSFDSGPGPGLDSEWLSNSD